MKKLTLILSFFCLLISFANAATVGIFKVADDTTVFGKIKAADTLILNASTGELFRLTTKATASDTLSTISAGDIVTSSPPIVSYMGTGVISWTGTDILAINADDTKFDIAVMDLLFIDKSDINPDNHTKEVVSCPVQTAVTATHLLTSVGTWIGYDSSCTIIQSPIEFTPEQRNNVAQIGRLGHFGKTVITGTFDLVWVYETIHNWAIEKAATGTTRIAGATVTANGANLKIDRSLGRFLRVGAGSARDIINYPQSPAAVQVSMIPAYNSATGEGVLGSATTDIDILQYDDLSGALQSVGAGQYANIFIYHFPYKSAVTSFFLYGNKQYSSLSEAEIGVLNKEYTIPSDITGGVIISGVSVLKETTDLVTAITGGTASITEPPFGGGGGGTSVSLWNKTGVDLSPATPGDNIKLTGNIQLGVATIEQDNITHAPIYSSGQSGLDDLSSSSSAYALPESAIFQVKIQSTGSPDDFEWRKGSIGAWSSPVAMTGSFQLLQDDIAIIWGSITGHTNNDTWEIHVGEEIHIDSTTHVDKDLIVTGDIIVEGAVRSLSPVKLLDGIRFISSTTGDSEFHQYISGTDSAITPLPSAFDGALVFKTNVGSNPSDMDAVFWDGINLRPSIVVNQGGTGRASVFERSLVVGAQKGVKALDTNYTIGTTDFPKLAFNTSATGADLGVENDVQVKGTMFVDTIGESTTSAGVTFLQFPITPSSAPTSDYQIANKKYVDDSISTMVIDNLILYYDFDDTGIIDRSRRGNNGTATGTTHDATGGFYSRGSRTFDGAGDFIISNSNIGISGADARTMSFWAQATGTGNQAFVGLGTAGDNTLFTVLILGGNWYLNGAGAGNDWATGIPADTDLHHHVITYDGITVHWYLDGEEIGSGFVHTYNTTDDVLKIGERAGANDFDYNGMIDEVKIYNVALTQDDITKLYQEYSMSVFTIDNVNAKLTVSGDGIFTGNSLSLARGLIPTTGSDRTAFNFGGGGSLIGATADTDALLTQNAYYNSGYKYLTPDFASALKLDNGVIDFLTAPSGTINAAIPWTTALIVQNDGNVGIGTATPGTLLEVTDPSSHTFLKINTIADNLTSNLEFFNNNVHKWSLSSAGAKDAPNDRLSILNASAGAEVMSFLQDGKVGIGTITPSSVTHIKANAPGVVGSSPAGQLIIQNPGITTDSNAVITGYNSDINGDPDQQLWYLGSSSGSNADIILLNRQNAPLHLGTSGVSRLTVHADGNVGIGTATPSEALEVTGNIKTSGVIIDNTIYAQLNSSVDQIPSTTNPVCISYNTQDAINGLTHSTTVNPCEITIDTTGVYFVSPQPQVSKDSGGTKVDFDMFLQVDRGSGFADEANSNIKLSIKDSDITDVIVSAFTVVLNVGDKIQMMQKTSATGVGMGLKNTDPVVGPPSVPRTPSIIFTMYRIGG